MATLTSLEKTWWSIANISAGAAPSGFVTSSNEVVKGHLFNIKAVLCGHTSSIGGEISTSVTRSANSIWSVVSSSNGTTASASDLWGTSFDGLAFVSATSTAPHSWIILENSNLGYQMLIDLSAATATTIRIAFTKTSDPFTPNATPTYSPSAPSSEGWTLGSTANATTTGYSVFTNDVTAYYPHHTHISVASTGEFIILLSRLGARVHNGFMGFMGFVDGDEPNTRNYAALSCTSFNASIGYPNTTLLSTAAASSRRTQAGSLMTAGGLCGVHLAANTDISAKYPDQSLPDGSYVAFPLHSMGLTPQVFYAGRLPDIYFSHGLMAGRPVNTALGKFVCAGNFLLPFQDVLPKI